MSTPNTEERLGAIVAQARAAAEAAVGSESPKLDENELQVLARFTSTLDRVETLAANVDESLMSDSMVTEVIAALNQATNPLAQIAAGQAINLTPTLSAATDQTLNTVALWPVSTGTKAQMSKAAASYAQSLGQRIAPLKKQLAGLVLERDNLTAALDDLRVQITAEREQAVGAVSENLVHVQAQVGQLLESIEQQQTRIDTFAAAFQEQFSNQQDKRGELFQAQLQEQANEAQEKATAADQTLNKATDALQQKGNAIVAEMDVMKGQAEGLIRVITATGTAAGYQLEGNAERRRADIFAVLAVAVALVAAASSVLLLEYLGGNKNQPTQWIIARIAVVLILVGVASYLAAQSAHHRRREVAARRKQLALAALEPFVAGLEQAERSNIRQILASGVFDVKDSGHEEQEAGITDSNITLIQRLFDVFGKFTGPH